jgi:hypothetical protein
LVLSASGSLAGRLGEEQAFTVTLSAGVLILFVGFMTPAASSTTPVVQRSVAVRTPAAAKAE